MAGFFGSVSQSSCVTDVFYGTDYHSHLGTRRAGMATFSPQTGFKRVIHSIENSHFRTKFEDELPSFCGNAGIGIISDTDAQPLLFNSHLGRFALSTVGKINNAEELVNQLLQENMHLSEFSSGKINPTELVGLLIIQGKTFVEGIENVYRSVKGSCSMLILTEDGIIAARDSWGRTPIIVGRRDGAAASTIGGANYQAYAVASESNSFVNLGFETTYFVGPGEIVKITADTMTQLRPASPRKQVCSFLWVYYGFPNSDYEGRNAEQVRNDCGRAMGEAEQVDIDCVCGIPDSGVGMAVGYAEGSGKPYRRAICKYTPTWPRSFTPSNQQMRELVAKMKLIHNTSILKDSRVLFCDDSIVRGTQLRDNTACLREAGAAAVHMRIACPPLFYGCPFINFSASKSDMELITRRIIAEFEGEAAANNPERISAYAITDSPEYKRLVGALCDRFQLDSLRFTTLETLVQAIGLPKEHICTHCFDGSSRFTLEETNL
ncbi:MAG: amidophosphoribosyltransferase [Paludibacteraceae bacterium]|nr:amidophosphoribosyltransferase [Paludibacteraceae bacterium]